MWSTRPAYVSLIVCLRALQEGDLDQPPLYGQAFQVLGDVVAADHVEDHVDPLAAGRLVDDLDEILGPIIDRKGGAQFLAFRAFFVGAGGGENARPEMAGKLDRGRADAARPAMDQEAFADLQPAPLEHASQQRLIDELLARVGGAALLIWCDHGYGALSAPVIDCVSTHARAAGLHSAATIGSRGDLLTLARTDLLTVSERRLRTAMHNSGDSLPSLVWNLLDRTGGRAAIVGLHKRGLLAFEVGDTLVTARVADVQGNLGPPRQVIIRVR